MTSPPPCSSVRPHARAADRPSVNVSRSRWCITRHLGIPSVTRARPTTCLEAGAQGITIHPRPDGRHIREQDVFELQQLMQDRPQREFNIEDNPFHSLMDIVRQVRPQQATFVPDSRASSPATWLEPGAGRRAAAPAGRRMPGPGRAREPVRGPCCRKRWRLSGRWAPTASGSIPSPMPPPGAVRPVRAARALYRAAARAAPRCRSGRQRSHDLNRRQPGQIPARGAGRGRGLDQDMR